MFQTMFGFIFVACKAPELRFSPEELDFGEVDFSEEMPEGGYSPLALRLTNESTKDLSLYITDFDFNHLCLLGFSDLPADLGSLSPDSSYSAMVSVCDYIEENGERDDLLQGTITVAYNEKYTLSIPWSFTPILDVSQDTGN